MVPLILGFWMLCAAGITSGISGLLGVPELGWFALGFGLVGLFNIGRGLYLLTIGRE